VTEQRSVRLFSLGASVNGEPSFIEPATFKALEAEELKDIERWIKREPEILGEEIRILASQFSNWNKTSDRPDLLGLDRAGKLVVIEIKRDGSGRDQDLQAIRYASYVSTLSSDKVIELYQAYRAREHGEEVSLAEATEELEAFVYGEDGIASLDEDDSPRLVLVAAKFRPGVTSTVLWLRRSFDVDISCVQVEPYELNGEIVLTSTTLIPLPEAADFEVRMQSKRERGLAKKARPVDWEEAKAFIASIPTGRWTSYGDVAAAAGSPRAAQSIGTWLRNEKEGISLAYRVLRGKGKVSAGWTATDPKLPRTAEGVQTRLEDEGVEFKLDKASQSQRWTPELWRASPNGLAGDPDTE
jgi:alkylated DNA nucleotide flippase Atl1